MAAFSVLRQTTFSLSIYIQCLVAYSHKLLNTMEKNPSHMHNISTVNFMAHYRLLFETVHQYYY